MPALPLAKGSYRRGDNVPTRLVNMLYEVDPTNLEDQVSLLSRFGLDDSDFDDVGAGPVRGVCRQEGATAGYAFVVSGTALRTIAPDGTATMVGAGTEVTGTARVRMATNGTDVMIAAGTSASAKLYTSDGVTAPTAVSTPDSMGVVDVACIGGVFLFLKQSSQRIYFSPAYETTIDPLDYFSAELTADEAVALITNGDELHIPGRTTTEVWVPYGDADLPFQRVDGRLSGGGCAARHGCTLVGDAPCWVGDDNAVYRKGVAFSTPDISAIIAKARPGLSDWTHGGGLNAWSYPFGSHELLILDVPGVASLAYDFSTSQWLEFKSHNLDLFRVGCAVKLSDGVWIGGDSIDGTIWKLDPEVTTDGDAPMVRTWTGLIEASSTVPNANVLLDCTVGQAGLEYPADTPVVQMRFSDDRGKTWAGWSDAHIGRQGNYDIVPQWRRLGPIRRPGRLYEFRFSEDMPLTVRKAAYNEKGV